MRALTAPCLALLAVLGLQGIDRAAVAATPPAAALPADSVYQFEATLADQDGRATAFHELRGKPRLVTFIYASCRYVCPLIVDSVKAIERELPPDANRRIGFVLITMDPARDTPPVLKRLMTERRLDAARWLLLQPSPTDLRGLAGVLGMRYRALADGGFNHTATLVLLDAEGRVVARSDRIGGRADREFLSAIERAIATPAD